MSLPFIKYILKSESLTWYIWPFINSLKMNYKLIIVFCAISINHWSWSQAVTTEASYLVIDSLAERYARTITEGDLNNYLSILASDALEGRDTGSRGQKMAAAFIREHFRDNRLKPIVVDKQDSAYFQTMDLYRNYYDEVYLEVDGKKFHNLDQLAFIGNANKPEAESYILQFVGDGEEQDYAGLEVQDQIVAFYATTVDERVRKMKTARDLGAAGVLVLYVETKAEFEEFLDRNSHILESKSVSKESGNAGSSTIFITSVEQLPALLGTTRQKLDKAYLKSQSASKSPFKKLNHEVRIKIEKVSERFETENVLGLVEGSDKKEELIVITAHYDHVGKTGDQIYNGADDDGSGTSAVMELAQAFALAKKEGNGPRRSILFMTVTGEEKGLLGSEFYSSNPVWPLEQTIANLNIDMIGRVDPAHENMDEYIYIIGSDHLSNDLHTINEEVNKLYTGLTLDYKYNDTDDPNRFYYRSDHYNFAKHNIPIIFYFNGTHEDYHQPTDTIDKIRFDLLKKRSDLVFYCAWELANREQSIRLND